MALINWDESMSVSVNEIDDQHKELISLINHAYEAIQKHDEHMMTELIDDMRAYANMHFSFEEKLMKAHNYPELEHHKFKHAKFKQEVDSFKKNQFQKTNLSQIFVFLSRWLTTHIMDEDMKYVSYIPKEKDATN